MAQCTKVRDSKVVDLYSGRLVCIFWLEVRRFSSPKGSVAHILLLRACMSFLLSSCFAECVFISWKEDTLKRIILFPFSPSSKCRKPSQPSHSTAAARRILTENQELMQAGERLMQREIDEYHRQGFEEGASEQHKTPLSPTTHTLVLPEDSPNHQRETFVWSGLDHTSIVCLCFIYLTLCL